MTFINEHISPEDAIKYGLQEIDKKYIVGGTSSRSWTIDKERGSYLRKVSNGREEFSHCSVWNLLWDGHLIELNLEIIRAEGQRGGHCIGHKRLTRLAIPLALSSKSQEVIADLIQALTVYRDGGVFSTASSYELDLELAISPSINA